MLNPFADAVARHFILRIDYNAQKQSPVIEKKLNTLFADIYSDAEYIKAKYDEFVCLIDKSPLVPENIPTTPFDGGNGSLARNLISLYLGDISQIAKDASGKSSLLDFIKRTIVNTLWQATIAALAGGAAAPIITLSKDKDTPLSGLFNDRTRYVVGRESFSMIYVKADTYDMGAQPGFDVRGNEQPMHRVDLSPFWLCEIPVTQGLWQEVMDEIRQGFIGDRNQPIALVSWFDANRFIKQLEQKLGVKGFRLPTEAEWEYADRGGEDSLHFRYSGSNRCLDVAWFEGNSDGHPQPVMQKDPNELGFYDMSGNVEEWCLDTYRGYDRRLRRNPVFKSRLCRTRITRGGSWASPKKDCRSTYRTAYPARYHSSRIGFRLAYDVVRTPCHGRS